MMKKIYKKNKIKITKKDISTYLKYGPMEFNLKEAMLLYYLIDLPINILIYFLIYYLRRII